jgi:hypothetical protein
METRRIPQQTRNIFEDFKGQHFSDDHSATTLCTAELAFSRLEARAELALEHLMQSFSSELEDRSNMTSVWIQRHELETLRRFFVFIRYRNGIHYTNLVQTIAENGGDHGLSIWRHIRRNGALSSMHLFLHHDSVQMPTVPLASEEMNRFCWSFMDAEVCLGAASDGQEFLMTESCIGNLDEGFWGDP